MKRSWAAMVGIVCALTITTACSSGSATKAAGPVTVSFWVPWTGTEAKDLNLVLAGFERTHPNIQVQVSPGVGGDTTHLLPAIVGGNAPDLANLWDLSGISKLCVSGHLTDLGSRMASAGITEQTYAAATAHFMQGSVHNCGIPQLGDAVGLYYNKSMFAAAHISSPPKTLSELAADTKKLTQYNSDGSVKVAGFVPLINFYSNYPAWFADINGVSWFTSAGKADLADDAGVTDFYSWQRGLVDDIGYQKLNRFAAAAGDAGSPQNAFETGKVAMIIDGEWRTQFIANDKSAVDYGTAPFPVVDSRTDRYGASAIAPGFLIVPKGAKHPDQAWELARYLSTDVDAVVQFANLLHNIPQAKAALDSPQLNLGPKVAPFISSFLNPLSEDAPAISAGSDYAGPLTTWAEKWQAGQIPVSDLHHTLQGVDQQIDTFITQNTPNH